MVLNVPYLNIFKFSMANLALDYKYVIKITKVKQSFTRKFLRQVDICILLQSVFIFLFLEFWGKFFLK